MNESRPRELIPSKQVHSLLLAAQEMDAAINEWGAACVHPWWPAACREAAQRYHELALDLRRAQQQINALQLRLSKVEAALRQAQQAEAALRTLTVEIVQAAERALNKLPNPERS